MGLWARTTNVSSTDVAVVPASTGRQLNIISIQITNTSSSSAVVDIKDGLAGTIIQSLNVDGFGSTWQTFCMKGELGRLLTAGNALGAATRSAATGIEVVVEYGRV